MARTHARVQAALWVDEDWRALGAGAQRTYLLLISQPQINNCGVLPLVPKRWARLATDTAVDDLGRWLDELEATGFVVCDWETDEVLVRTFIRHDRIEDQPNLTKAAKRQFEEIESTRIQHVLFRLYDWLAEDLPEPLREALSKPLPEPLRLGVPVEGVSEPLREGVNARAREGGRGRGSGRGGSSVVGEEQVPGKQATSATDREPGLPAGREEALDEEPEPTLGDLPMAETVGGELERLRARGATA